ncbi:cytochrome b [Aeromonas sp. CA23]|uniref:cytochrome b n=1 Tax=Aeromonas sp. CA23 TaxID=2033032 RepID=UPI0020A41F56|nr:cytochrome b [Aeromonas sp. CA23]
MIVDHSPPLSLLTRFLHWSVALLMIGLTLLGYLMVKLEIWALYPLHKSLGVVALLLVVPRAIVRLGKGWPAPVRQYPRYEAMTAKMIHWGLLISTLLIPVSGICYSGAAGRGVTLFGWFIIPMNPDSNDPENVIPYSESLSDITHSAHVYLPYIMLAFVLIHIVGAVKHHLLDKDKTLMRMLGRTSPER